MNTTDAPAPCTICQGTGYHCEWDADGRKLRPRRCGPCAGHDGRAHNLPRHPPHPHAATEPPKKGRLE